MRLILFLIITNITFGQNFKSPLEIQLKEYVSFLSSDSMQGREVGSTFETNAGKYFLDQTSGFHRSKQLKWNFEIELKDTIISSTMVGRFVDNKAKQTIILGAHIDHIGMGDSLSMSFTNNEIHNGADDNASGVAVLIAIHNIIANCKLPYNFLFVAFTAHEIGLYGSNYLSKNLPRKIKEVKSMLNFDMVGRMNIYDSTIYYSNTDTIMFKFNSDDCYFKKSSMEKVNILDSKHFVSQNIPSVTFTTGIHRDYHKTSDDEKYINYYGMVCIVNTIINWVNKLPQ